MKIDWRQFRNAAFDRLKNDFHVPVALLVFGLTSAYTMHTGKDLQPNYVTSINFMYLFLGGHALIQTKWGNDAPTTNTETAPTPKPPKDVD
jgi:hypothetical protein